MVAVLPFRARRRFRLDGEEIEAGQVIDVAGLTPTRVRQLEATNYGMRVAAEQPDHEVVVSPASDSLPSPAAGEPADVEGVLGPEGAVEHGEEELEGIEPGSSDALLEIDEPAGSESPSIAAEPATRASARQRGKASPSPRQKPGARKRS